MSPPLLLFDGHCRFCNAWVRFVLRYERQPRYRFAPLQSRHAREVLAPYGRAADDLSSVVVLDGGRMYLKSDAALHLLAELRQPWRGLRVLRILPRRWRDALYTLAGALRYRLFGRSAYCAARRPAQSWRFIGADPDEKADDV